MPMSTDRVRFKLSRTALWGLQPPEKANQLCSETLNLTAEEVAVALSGGEIEVICRPSQFARFLVKRNEMGGQNQFAALCARLEDAPPVPKHVDVSQRHKGYKAREAVDPQHLKRAAEDSALAAAVSKPCSNGKPYYVSRVCSAGEPGTMVKFLVWSSNTKSVVVSYEHSGYRDAVDHRKKIIDWAEGAGFNVRADFQSEQEMLEAVEAAGGPKAPDLVAGVNLDRNVVRASPPRPAYTNPLIDGAEAVVIGPIDAVRVSEHGFRVAVKRAASSDAAILAFGSYNRALRRRAEIIFLLGCNGVQYHVARSCSEYADLVKGIIGNIGAVHVSRDGEQDNPVGISSMDLGDLITEEVANLEKS